MSDTPELISDDPKLTIVRYPGKEGMFDPGWTLYETGYAEAPVGHIEWHRVRKTYVFYPAQPDVRYTFGALLTFADLLRQANATEVPNA